MVFHPILQVNVTINDLNDNEPTFASSLAVLPIVENLALNVPFYTVKASDPDTGLNSRVRYQITVDTDQMFEVDPVTGELSLKVGLTPP